MEDHAGFISASSLSPVEEEADWLRSSVSDTLAVMVIMGIKNVRLQERSKASVL